MICKGSVGREKVTGRAVTMVRPRPPLLKSLRKKGSDRWSGAILYGSARNLGGRAGLFVLLERQGLPDLNYRWEMFSHPH